MKRIVVFCVAFALAVSLFSQASNPASRTILTLQDLFTKQPLVQVEFLGGAGYAHEPVFPTIWDSSGGSVYTSTIGFNSNYTPFFYSVDKITIGFDNLYLSAVLYFDWNHNSLIMPSISTVNLGYFNQGGTEASKLASLGLTYTSDLLNYTSTLYYDIDNIHSGSNLFFMEQGLTLQVKNIKARISTLNSWNGTITELAWSDLVITDAFVTMEKLFSLVTFTIGGNEEQILRIRSLFAPEKPEDRLKILLKDGLFYSPFVTQETISGGQASGLVRWLGIASVDGVNNVKTVPTSCLPLVAVFDFAEKAKLPLTIFVSAPIPNNDETLSGYFNKQVATIALRYDVKGTGSFDAGWTPGIGYDLPGPVLSSGVWYSPNRQPSQNIFFLDALFNFEKLAALTILTGFNMIFGEFEAADTVSGSGIAANDPRIRAYVNDFILHYGLEAKYDFRDSIKGLTLALGLYVKYGTGKTFANQTPGLDTFQQYIDASFPVATWYRMSTFTEESIIQRLYYAHNPLVLYMKAGYQVNPSVWIGLQNIYTSSEGFLDGISYWNVTEPGAKRPIGFYDADRLSLEAIFTEGLVKLGLELRCKFLLGLPSASDLGYNDAMAQNLGYSTADSLYKSQAPYAVRYPWSLNINYTILF